MLNVGLALEVEQLDATGAAGIGLFRTEIAMLARGAVADVAEQAAIYARVLDAAGDRPGAVPHAGPGRRQAAAGRAAAGRRRTRRWAGAACASGWTGRRCCGGSCARCCWPRPGGRCRVMFPMVATVAEFRAARALLLAEAARVRPAAEPLSRSAP